MDNAVSYKCPQCGASLSFNSQTQQWDCKFCLGSFEKTQLESTAMNQTEPEIDEETLFSEETAPKDDPEFMEHATVYTCPSCGAQIVTDKTTAATFCVFCQNPAVLSGQLKGEFRPHQLIPFKKSKKEAQDAFVQLCKGKPLLPKDFYSQNRIEKITGVYVPFWLFDCDTNSSLTAQAQRVSGWSDSKYHYTKTEFFSVFRKGNINFDQIPADGSTKMNDALMDSIEPYDFSELREFSMPYLSGYLAEIYDVNAQKVYPRIKIRMDTTSKNLLNNTIKGYTSCFISNHTVNVKSQKHNYVMLPVWMLVSKYKNKDYLFSMNGQTGKIIGDLPVSTAKAFGWFGAIFAIISAIIFLILFFGGLSA